ncbi:MAG: molybdopterin-dependent oxidoreductase [Thermodesulfobacteriota bacterium]|nr:molybdopterin-dependent oxidoreductase [Thermodesulfobacteriota bacterium]
MNGIDRRQFLKALGGGIIIFFSKSDLVDAQTTPSDFNAFLRIGEDGRVSCYTGKVEMGQGIITSLAQILAEELDVPFHSIEMIMGDTSLCPWDMGTFGSRSIKIFGPLLREAAAEARAILIQLAAERLGLPLDRMELTSGVIRDKKNPQNQISYALLAQGKKITRRLEKKPPLKPASTFTVSGKPVSRQDALAKATGQAKFSGDIRLPGMVYARILRPPAHGAKLKKVDTSSAEKIKGAQIIRDGDLIAILHSYPDEAEQALAQIKAQFELPENKLTPENIFNHLLKVAPGGNVIGQEGNLDQGKKVASTTFTETYLQQYVAHAPIETHTALAQVEKNKATVWASTQRPFGARDEVARALNLPPENVRIITPFLGGGFGGKNYNGQVVEAARLARLAGKPVQVAWSREEEFFYDTFQPAALVQIESGLNGSNQITFWDYRVYFAGDRGAQIFYAIPHHRTASHGTWWGAPGAHPFATGPWRGPASNTNSFARESHIDLMAAKAGVDPLTFRLAHLSDKRMRRVLESAATTFGWLPAKAPSGRGQGVACGIYLGTYIATMAEVEVDKQSGTIKVKRVVCAQDMGQIINPEGARMQVEGCMMMGLGYALTEEINFRGGEIRDRNFNTYEIPRFSRMPKIEAVLVDNPEIPSQGGGEPAITCMGAVIANAVFNATGARIFELPITPERFKKALAKGV